MVTAINQVCPPITGSKIINYREISNKINLKKDKEEKEEY